MKHRHQKNLFSDEVVQNVESEWQGMPECISEPTKPYATIIFRFDNAEDLKEFSELIGQPLNKKTKSARYPALIKGINLNKLYDDAS